MRLRQDRERTLSRTAAANRGLPGSLDGIDLEAVCNGVSEWLTEAAGEDMALVADALGLEVSASPGAMPR